MTICRSAELLSAERTIGVFPVSTLTKMRTEATVEVKEKKKI